MKQAGLTKHFLDHPVKIQDEAITISSKDIVVWREYIDQQSPDILGEYTHDIPRLRELLKNYAWRKLTPNKAWDEFWIMWKNYASEIRVEMRALKKSSASNWDTLDMSRGLFLALYEPYLVDTLKVSWVQDEDILSVPQSVCVSENAIANIQEVVRWEMPVLLGTYREPVSNTDVYTWVGMPERKREWGWLRIRNSTNTTYSDLKNIIKAQLKTVFSNAQPSKKSNIFGDYLLETTAAPIHFPYFSPLNVSSSSLSQEVQLDIKCILGPNSRDRILTYLKCIENKTTFEEGIGEKFSTKIPCKLKLWVVLIERRESLIGSNRDDKRYIDFTIEMLGQSESK